MDIVDRFARFPARRYAESAKLTPSHYRQIGQWHDASSGEVGRKCKPLASPQPTSASAHDLVCVPLFEENRKGLPVTTRHQGYV